MKRGLLVISFLALATGTAFARDPAVVRAFRATHPCPATGLATGSCPGWVVDHLDPLCAGDPDAVTNMAWQAAADAAKKDVIEKQLCAMIRKERRP